MILLHIRLLENKSHHDGDVMWIFLLLVFLGAVVLMGRQQLAPQFLTDCLGRCQVNREAWRIPQAFKATFKFISHHNFSNTRDVQIMELMSWIQTFFRVLLQSVWFYAWEVKTMRPERLRRFRNIWQSNCSTTARKGVELKSYVNMVISEHCHKKENSFQRLLQSNRKIAGSNPNGRMFYCHGEFYGKFPIKCNNDFQF